jgi:hypothetical protein
MDITEVVGWIFLGLVLILMVWALSIVIPDAYNEIRTYQILQNECEANPDVCFCEYGSCSVKSSCSYTQINDQPQTGGCDHTKICNIARKANWKEGLWDYDCGIIK